MEGELDILHVEKKIRSRVKQQMEKSQREYYLNEQMKAIQKELGEIGDESNDLDQLLKIPRIKIRWGGTNSSGTREINFEPRKKCLHFSQTKHDIGDPNK